MELRCASNLLEHRCVGTRKRSVLLCFRLFLKRFIFLSIPWRTTLVNISFCAAFVRGSDEGDRHLLWDLIKSLAAGLSGAPWSVLGILMGATSGAKGFGVILLGLLLTAFWTLVSVLQKLMISALIASFAWSNKKHNNPTMRKLSEYPVDIGFAGSGGNVFVAGCLGSRSMCCLSPHLGRAQAYSASDSLESWTEHPAVSRAEEGAMG